MERKKYRIDKIYNKSIKQDTFSVYLNNRFTGRYLEEKDARKKVYNYLTNYRHCEPEIEVKNVMFHSDKNCHNSIV